MEARDPVRKGLDGKTPAYSVAVQNVTLKALLLHSRHFCECGDLTAGFFVRYNNGALFLVLRCCRNVTHQRAERFLPASTTSPGL